MNFDEELMPRQLPVDDWDTTEDFDPSVPPRTPQEYLKRVQIEASRCPEVVVAKIDPRKLKSNQTVNISSSELQHFLSEAPSSHISNDLLNMGPILYEFWHPRKFTLFDKLHVIHSQSSYPHSETISNICQPVLIIIDGEQHPTCTLSGCQPAPAGFSPSLRWQQQQVANFSILRQSIDKHRDHWKSQPLDSNVMLPSPEDEEGWKKFCLGEKLYLNSSPINNEIDNPGIDYVQVGFPPLLSIVSRMSQPTIFNILEYLISWFGDKKLYPELGRWLYALLACIEKPLLPEAHSLIRQLARRCSEVRAKLENPEDGELSALNLLICLVARYFEQCDLADND